LYFTSYFRLFKYMVSFSRYFTMCITYQPLLVILHYSTVIGTDFCSYLGRILTNINELIPDIGKIITNADDA